MLKKAGDMHADGLRTRQQVTGSMPAGGWARGLRAGVAAVVTVALATFAHRFGHGELLSISVFIVVAAAASLVAYAVTARRVRVWHLIGLLGGAQLAVHYLSEYVSAGAHHHGESAPLLMLSGHLGATLLSAAVLAHGERAWWWWLQWLHRPVVILARFVPVTTVPTLVLPTQIVKLICRVGSGTIGGRAPPACQI